MDELVVSDVLLFNVLSKDGKQIRTHLAYWQHIMDVKHKENTFDVQNLKEVIKDAEFIETNQKDTTIRKYYKTFGKYIIIAVVKILNGDGFLITCYQTSKKVLKEKI